MKSKIIKLSTLICIFLATFSCIENEVPEIDKVKERINFLRTSENEIWSVVGVRFNSGYYLDSIPIYLEGWFVNPNYIELQFLSNSSYLETEYFFSKENSEHIISNSIHNRDSIIRLAKKYVYNYKYFFTKDNDTIFSTYPQLSMDRYFLIHGDTLIDHYCNYCYLIESSNYKSKYLHRIYYKKVRI